NLVGTILPGIALACGIEPTLSRREVIEAVRAKLSRRIPPAEVDPLTAPVNENVQRGDDVDLEIFPVPQHWPHDGGRYIGTADAIVTRDPDHGHLNLGTYRMMLHDKRHVGLYLSPGKDARLHIS